MLGAGPQLPGFLGVALPQLAHPRWTRLLLQPWYALADIKEGDNGRFVETIFLPAGGPSDVHGVSSGWTGDL